MTDGHYGTQNAQMFWRSLFVFLRLLDGVILFIPIVTPVWMENLSVSLGGPKIMRIVSRGKKKRLGF